MRHIHEFEANSEPHDRKSLSRIGYRNRFIAYRSDHEIVVHCLFDDAPPDLSGPHIAVREQDMTVDVRSLAHMTTSDDPIVFGATSFHQDLELLSFSHPIVFTRYFSLKGHGFSESIIRNARTHLISEMESCGGFLVGISEDTDVVEASP
jgi:hypothetical protein